MSNQRAVSRRRSDRTAIDTLRLTSSQQREIHSHLDGSLRRQVERELRSDKRYPYRTQTPIELQIQHPGGSTETYHVQPRNISATGVGLLHGGFIHPGSVCFVHLVRFDDSRIEVRGRVARCRLITGRVHEVGIVFDDPIDLDRLGFEFEKEGSAGLRVLPAMPDVPPTLRSQLWREPKRRALIPGYVDRMKDLIQQLTRSLRTERMLDATQFANELSATARSYGYPEIAETAEHLTDLLQEGSAAQLWKAQVLRLAALCDSAYHALEAA